MTNHSNKRKFLATTLTATMVAAAVAPVGAAAATEAGSFPDVPAGHWAADAINYLVAKNAINGLPDGTYGPTQNISRGAMAKLLAESLENVEVVEGAKSSFSDVSANHYAAAHIAALEKAGIIDGNEKGLFSPSETLTRESAAKMIVEAYGLELDEKADFNFSDNTSWGKDYINVVASLGILAGTDAGLANPKGDLTRAALAQLVHRAEVPTERVEVPQLDDTTEVKVESVSAINAKQVLVKFSGDVGAGASEITNYAVRNIANGLANDVIANGAEVQADGKSVLLTLTDEYRVGTDVSVTVDGIYVAGSIKDQFPKFSTVINFNDTVAPTISSVSANVTSTGAAQEVTVNFSEPIKPGAIFRINGKTVSATTDSIETEWSITSQDLEVGKTHELEVLHAEDYADNKVASLVKTFVVEQDTVEATGKVSTVQDNKVLIKFDKAITSASLTNVKFFNYDGTDYNTVAPVGTPTSPNGKDWTFVLDTDTTNFYDVNDNKEEVLVKVQTGVIDTAGNPVKNFEEKVTFTQDKTGPALQNVTVDKNSKGEVTKLYLAFDELLTATAGELQTYLDNAGAIQAAADVDVAHVNQYLSLVNKVSNLGEDFTDVFGAPTSIALATDGKTVIVEIDPDLKKVTNGNYKLTATASFVMDSAAGVNGSKKVTQDLNIGAVANVVSVETVTTTNAFTGPAATAGDNKFTIEFTQPVTADSAKNPANYQFNGKALPADTVIKVTAENEVEFILPEGFIAKDEEEAKLTITNIKPKDSSATFKSYLDVDVVLDNTAPVAKATILSSGEIHLTFSEAVNLDVADFANTVSKVYINGLELTKPLASGAIAFADGTSSSTLAGDAGVKITVAAEEELDLNGFSYLYIDIDGDGNFDLNKDLVLAQVKSVTAPAAWTAVADLNSSVIKSVEVKTQTADNATVDTSFLVNKLESGAIIKVK